MVINSTVRSSGSLFEKYRERFILFAHSYVKDMDLAEDVYMEAFLSYWEKRGQLPANTNIPAYLLTSVKHKALNHLRNSLARDTIQNEMHEHTKRELTFRITSLEACNPDELFSVEIKQLVAKTLQDLPEQTRRIFLKSREEAKTHKEIAAELGISQKSVEFHITKALKAFRLRLKDYLPFLTLLLLK